MKTFLVELKMQLGEYQKYTKKLLKANTPESAGKRALVNECHHTLGDGAEMHGDDECEDDYGGMYYSVYRVTEIPAEHVEILNQYLS